MELEQLAQLVLKMLDAQRDYYHTRDVSILARSKTFESQVSKACKKILDKQRTLFGD